MKIKTFKNLFIYLFLFTPLSFGMISCSNNNKSNAKFKEEIIQERIEYQKNYCVQQMKNEKTSMVLLKYFDEKWVNKYIKTVLFDF